MSKEFVEAVSSAISKSCVNPVNNAITDESLLTIYSMEISTPLPSVHQGSSSGGNNYTAADESMNMKNKRSSYLGSLASDFLSLTEEDHFNECNVSRWYFIGKEFTTRNTEEGSSDDTMKTATCFVGSVISEDGMYSWKFDGSQQKVVLVLVEDNDCHLPDPSLFYFKSQPSIPNQYTISHYDSVEGNVVLSDCIQWNAETKEMESLQTAAGTAGSNIQFTISGLPTECVY